MSERSSQTSFQSELESNKDNTTAENVEALLQRAALFPSMGGSQIGEFLRKLAREAPADTAIVEVGSWLGAGTAQLAVGIRERGKDQSVKIYTHDRWTASESEVEKAANQTGLQLSRGQDTLPWVTAALAPFGVKIAFTKGDISAITWNSGSISVYVDDAAKTPRNFFHILRTFGPSWIPGVTVLVLMDYFYWEKSGSENHKCQKYFIEAHSENFARIEGFRSASIAAFNYCKELDFKRLSLDMLSRRAGA
jgi:hypothetical protein